MMFSKKTVTLVSVLLFTLAGCGGGGGGSTLPWSGTKQEAQLVSIEVTPANSILAVNTSRQFLATGIYSDNSKKDLTASVTWTSSNTNVATVGTSTGIGTAVISANPFGQAASAVKTAGQVYTSAQGTTTIKASWGKLWGSSDLTVKRSSLVSIAVTPTNPAIATHTNQQFTATGTFADNTTQDITTAVLWSSSNTAIATISNSTGSVGLAASLAGGSTTITATSGSISGSTTLTVNGATLVSIAVTPANPSIAKGTDQQFTATGTFSDNTTQNLTTTVVWNSSNTGVATISNTAGSNGLASSVAAGTTTITATSGSVSGSTTLTVNAATLVSIAVTPANPAIADGTSQQFTATGTFSDNTTQNLTTTVVWNSSNTGVATISNAAGYSGLASSVAAGSTTISATSGGVSGSTTLTVNPATLVSIAVTPVNTTIGKATTQQFVATGTYSDSTKQTLTAAVTWSSSNTGVATISNAAGSNGLATAVAAGSTTIKAVSGSVSGTAALAVTDRSATLTWSAPTTNTDGTALTDLTGYKIYYGISSGNYTTVINLGLVTSYVVNNLSSGTYYFAVTAVNSSGSESNYSNEGSKTIQ